MEFIIGWIFGAVAMYLLYKQRKPSGTFVMDFSNPEEEFCKLIMDEDLNSIYTKKEIILRIEAKDFNSQE